MDRRTIVAAGVGVLAVACAVGAAGTGRSTVDVETFNAQGRSEVTIEVTDWHSGGAIAEALVILECSCLSGSREAYTRADGAFTFRDVPPGRYTVQLLYRRVEMDRRLDVAAGQRGRVTFSVVPGEQFRIG